MKRFTDFISRVKDDRRFRFVRDIAIYYVLIMVIYVYLMWANLSTAPDFVYAQF